MPLARFDAPFEQPGWIFEPLCGGPHNEKIEFAPLSWAPDGLQERERRREGKRVQ
jgi:hypothetical protein